MIRQQPRLLPNIDVTTLDVFFATFLLLPLLQCCCCSFILSLPAIVVVEAQKEHPKKTIKTHFKNPILSRLFLGFIRFLEFSNAFYLLF